MIPRVLRTAWLWLTACLLAVTLTRPVLALTPGAAWNAQCQFTPDAAELLRKFYEARPSAVVRLVKAISIFPCDVQNRYLEALGIASGDYNTESRAILERALEAGKWREAACVKQMDPSLRLRLSELTRREKTLFMLRIPCFEQRRILTKCATQEFDEKCERTTCRRLMSDWRESLRLSLEAQILRQSEGVSINRRFGDN